MGLTDWLKEKGIYEAKRVPPRPDKKPPRIAQREPRPDELTLGFNCIEDESGSEVWKMKGVPQSDRLTHFYIVGASGTGKTKLLEHLISQDIKHGFGFAIIDPHGDLIDRTKEILAILAEEGLEERVVLIDPTDEKYTISFNPLELTEGYTPARQAQELVEVFKRIWIDAWGDRMADIFRNTLIVLIENNLTLDEVPRFLTDAAFRTPLVRRTENEKVREYFQNEFGALSPKTRSEWITSTLNKVRTFLADEAVRDIFLSPKSSFNFRKVMDEGKVLLVRLPKGLLGTNSDLLGSLILSKIQMAAFSRADTPQEKRVPFYLYIDEFQNFAAENFGHILDESRKYKLALTLAHQNLGQIPTKLKSSLLNCPLQAYFRVSRADAEVLAKELFVGANVGAEPWETYFQVLQSLSPRTCYAKNKNGGGIVLISVPPADWVEIAYREMENQTKASMLKEFRRMKEWRIGEHYLRERKAVREEYRTRTEAPAGNGDTESFREKDGAADYEGMIRRGENDAVEFKSSLRWGYEQRGVNKLMECMAAEAISAFMNAEGGTLFIGVRDNGEILGLENDFSTVSHKSKDGFLLQFTNVINQYLGKEFHQYTSVKIVPIGEKDICVVEVSKSKMPVFLQNAGKEEFYVRASASSQRMSMSEANDYIKTHFPASF